MSEMARDVLFFVVLFDFKSVFFFFLYVFFFFHIFPSFERPPTAKGRDLKDVTQLEKSKLRNGI